MLVLWESYDLLGRFDGKLQPTDIGTFVMEEAHFRPGPGYTLIINREARYITGESADGTKTACFQEAYTCICAMSASWWPYF